MEGINFDWLQALQSIGFFALIGFLGQQFIKRYFDNQHFKYTSLHSKRMDVLHSVYSKLVLFENGIRMLVIAGDGKEDQDLEKIYNTYFELKRELATHDIFLTEDLAKKIESLISRIHSAVFKYHNINRDLKEKDELILPYDRDHHIFLSQSIRTNWDNAFEICENEIPPLLETLRREFRKTIGVK